MLFFTLGITVGDCTSSRLAASQAGITGAAGAGSETTWRAPFTAGRAWVWAVLRDDRGGVDFGGLALEIAR